MSGALALWPQQASAYAGRVDLLIWAYTAVVVALTAPVFILIAVFAVKYRRGRKVNRVRRENSSVLVETSWSVIPFLLTVAFFVYAANLYFGLHRPPADSIAIDVVAKQWMWKFQHPEGQRELNVLHVPAGRPVKLTMTSQDVIHSLFLPELRIKQDVLPGRYTTLWFNADKPGVYRLFCAEFCGADHSVMGGQVVVMKPSDYAAWLTRAGADRSLAAQGADLYRTLGCGGCHDQGSAVRAPSLAGLYGRPVPLADGRVVRADDQYIRDSILQPNREVAAGYEPLMPTFANLVSEDQVMALAAYLRSLQPPAADAAPGASR